MKKTKKTKDICTLETEHYIGYVMKGDLVETSLFS